MSVVRGQIVNIRRALRERSTPVQLAARMPLIVVHQRKSNILHNIHATVSERIRRTTSTPIAPATPMTFCMEHRACIVREEVCAVG
jgi:hypothetical protein